MPSLTQPPTKKRRHDDHDANGEYQLFPQDFHHDFYQQHHGTHPRRIIQISSPLAKKIRMSTEWAGGEWSGDEDQRQAQLAPTLRYNHSRLPVATKSAPKTTTTTTTNHLLSPCHICHRKPTKKNELDSYADCEGCGERTCYVCIRACLGWNTTTHNAISGYEVLMRDQDSREDKDEDLELKHFDYSYSMEDAPAGDNQEHGPQRNDLAPDQDPTNRGGTWEDGNRGHRGRICSQCCVEKGPEGEVICLGCLES
ncbi:hypothetical protein VPNG_00123 [Cytospora leucostoma]|uniref:Uncharacterized protein n=1 Tax=Cytospora leucostoma TaxID=1230097 RepID=A0A423XNZ2_9PEZI|nr:hypothetical protein VPNG_00123 [Cytospora leucostoma]